MASTAHQDLSDYVSHQTLMSANDPLVGQSVKHHPAHPDAPHGMGNPLPPQLPETDFANLNMASKVFEWIVFHVLNAIIGSVGFAIAIAGIIAVPTLLVFFCLGAPVLQLLFLLLKKMSVLDVAMANRITPAKDKIYIHPDIDSGLTLDGSRSMASRLFYVSTRSCLNVVYFATVKFFFAAISASIFHLVLGNPIVAIATGGDRDVTIGNFSLKADGGLYYAAIILMAVGGLVLIPVNAYASRKLTAIFCGQRRNASTITYSRPTMPTAS